MGDPKKHRKKYSSPAHPWRKDRIEQEKELMQIYQFKNKKELWKGYSLLRKFMRDAKKLTALKTKQAEKEKIELLARLVKLGLLNNDSNISDVLNIELKSLLDRRLQAVVYKKGLSRSMKQARQFIVHRHIFVNGKVISQPSYYVPLKDETGISFRENSSLNDAEHPERKVVVKASEEKIIEESRSKKEKKPKAKSKEKNKEKTEKKSE